MKAGSKILIGVGAVLYFMYHFYTLGISPMPWMDEILFHALSRGYHIHDKLLPLAQPFAADQHPVVQYGPVYFWLGSKMIAIFGNGQVYFRMLSFASGLIFIFVAWHFIKRNFSGRLTYLVLCIFILDPVLNASMHGGRMDLLAAAFAFGSMVMMLRINPSEPNNLWKVIGSALLGAAGCLTTPRAAILFIPLAFNFLSRWFSNPWKKELKIQVLWGITFSIFPLIWVLFSFDGNQIELGSYNPFWSNLFFENEWRKYPMTLVVLMLLPFLSLAMVLHGKFNEMKPEVLLSLIGIAGFLLLVFENGAYYVMVLPFFYRLLILLSTSSSVWFHKILLGAFLTFNAGVFLYKGGFVLLTKEERKMDIASEFVRQNIPPGSKVIGDEYFYFPVVENGSDFQFINWFKDAGQREKYHREQYDYDYILISDMLIRKSGYLLPYYAGKSRLEKIDVLPPPPIKQLPFPYSTRAREVYSGMLFKRVKP